MEGRTPNIHWAKEKENIGKVCFKAVDIQTLHVLNGSNSSNAKLMAFL